ncbi:ninjurin-2-like isoform X2 [Ruditapes philippinarum]|uniref:ninjurin-2-like isoform X2 n=1 Tax=Ruditapes philippinarum TaxID=129788 RepID=UPI00295BB8F0|nr:ninjurin-2-like isoform X2 [Ruditapes philippinarum]
MSSSNSTIALYGTADSGTVENKSSFDFNKYATKKTVSKGLLNIGLLTSNAMQLKTTISQGSSHSYFYLNIVMITISIVLQIVLAILLVKLGLNKGQHDEAMKSADRHNNVVTGIVAVITVINILISIFTA